MFMDESVKDESVKDGRAKKGSDEQTDGEKWVIRTQLAVFLMGAKVFRFPLAFSKKL